MSTGDAGVLTQWYRDRIGEPETGDEVTGYWVFVLGAVLGLLGIALFLGSETGGNLRRVSIVLASAGLAFLIAGPMVRLPIKRIANLLVYVGVLISVVAIVWFAATYPGSWDPQSGQPAIIGLYALGVFVMVVGGVFLPLVAGRSAREADELRDELDDLQETLADTAADETDLAATVSDLREALEDALADHDDLAAVIRDLRGQVADTAADEADLAEQLRALRQSQARFELYEDNAGDYRWRLRHRNGNVIADGGEGYTRKHNAQKGLTSVRNNALGASLLMIEPEEELPEEGEEFEPFEEVESQAAFELYEDNRGDYRWRLRHRNGDVLADSGEGYSRARSREEAIERVREYADAAEYLEVDPTAFEVYRDAEGAWRWRLVHRNGNVLADGGQGYTRRRDARRAIDRVRDLDDLDFEVYEDSAGEHRWRLQSANNRIVADSGEGYSSRSEAENAVERVEEYAPEADVLDVGWAAFEIYEDSSGDHRWRLRHRNGNILADGGQGYADWSRARDGVESVKRNAPNAEIEDVED